MMERGEMMDEQYKMMERGEMMDEQYKTTTEAEEEMIPLIEVMEMPAKKVVRALYRRCFSKLKEDKKSEAALYMRCLANEKEDKKSEGGLANEKEDKKSEVGLANEKEDKKSEGVSIEWDAEEELCKKGITCYTYDFDEEVIYEDETESDEEVVTDRDEYDCGSKFVVEKLSRTVTNPKFPRRTYFSRDDEDDPRMFFYSVLHDPGCPVAQISKLALQAYNKIEDTEYEYVGLVKAYERAVNGFYFWTRFKAHLPGQDDIDFEAHTFQAPKYKAKGNAQHLCFLYVYPLPPRERRVRFQPRRSARLSSMKKKMKKN